MVLFADHKFIELKTHTEMVRKDHRRNPKKTHWSSFNEIEQKQKQRVEAKRSLVS